MTIGTLFLILLGITFIVGSPIIWMIWITRYNKEEVTK